MNFYVEGSDNNFYSPMDQYLEREGISCHNSKDLKEDLLKQFDLIVVGNVVPRDSKDARIIKGLGVDYCSFPAVLGAFVLKDKKVVAIAGTHGKTTTSYFATQIFEKLGEDSGYFIGGVIDGRGSSKIGKSKYFFIEGDEYDSSFFEKFSKFHSYCVNDVIVTSLDFDHGDIFESIKDIQKEFIRLFDSVKGKVILCEDYKALKEIAPQNTIFYGNEFIKFKKEEEAKTYFELFYNGVWLEFETNISGRHNIFNIASVILFALEEKFPYEKLKKSLFDLEFAKRRQELRGKYKGAIIIDDFAHHPRAIEVTVDAIKNSFREREIIVF